MSIVHVVVDDEAIREGLCAMLGSVSIETRTYASAVEFLAVAAPGMQGCLVLDAHLPDVDGLELQKVLSQEGIHVPIIMISADGDVSMAVRAMKAGAVDFLLKPFSAQELLVGILAATKTGEG